MTDRKLYKLEPYEFHSCGKVYKNESFRKTIHLFGFKTINNSYYIVEVEEYDLNFFALKFFRKKERPSKYRYHNVSNLEGIGARKVIYTCIEIGLRFLKNCPEASFGFLGSPTRVEATNKTFSNTKRYRVYKKFATNFFNPENFLHYVDEDRSAYLIINNHALTKNKKYHIELIDKFENSFDVEQLYSLGAR
ncbi:MAG: hypothetical protein K9I36_15775 [Bacteroidia bacterium]|nr:hypothetical protein [Bacteroidia bacterium]MCF8428196.1 hypothetical protein [Bacteroidia bacterium]